MFQRTFSFWRRLVGGGAPAAPGPAAAGRAGDQAGGGAGQSAQEERRLWVRYPANLTANVQPAAGMEELRVPARVRDISLGGANLLVDRAFETGQLLSIELPHREGEETNTVLACVVRAVPESGGQWALGCVFSRELSDETLEGFGAKKVRLPPSDKRTWMRFPTNVQARFQKIGEPESRVHDAQVLNLSASGVGLLVDVPVETGALLSLDLVGHAGQITRTILACVVHVTSQSGTTSALGCNFIRQLSEDDLKALLE